VTTAERYWASGFPIGRPIGVKYVVRNVVDDRGEPLRVKLELYVDMTDAVMKYQRLGVREIEPLRAQR